jgi:hypothetical protein
MIGYGMFSYTLLCMIDTIIQHFSPNMISAIFLLIYALVWSFTTHDYIIATPVVIFIWNFFEEKNIINIFVIVVPILEFMYAGWYNFYRKSKDCTEDHVNECKKNIYYSTVLIFVAFSKLSWVIGLVGLITCGMVIFYIIYLEFKEHSTYSTCKELRVDQQELFGINDDDI